jgi:hypothetical protein
MSQSIGATRTGNGGDADSRGAAAAGNTAWRIPAAAGGNELSTGTFRHNDERNRGIARRQTLQEDLASWLTEEVNRSGGISGDLFADQFFKLTELLLDSTGNLFRSAFRFESGIVGEFASLLFRVALYFVEFTFELLPCAVWHFSCP